MSLDSELERLIDASYEILRGIARRRMASEKGCTLDPTDLLHEAVLRLRKRELADEVEAKHAVAQAMGRVLIDFARRREKRVRIVLALDEPRETDVSTAVDALEQVAAKDPIAADVAAMKVFGGFKVAEIAELIGKSQSTAERHWRFARTFLSVFVSEAPGGAA